MDEPEVTPEIDEFATGYTGAETPVTAETLANDVVVEGLTANIDEIASTDGSEPAAPAATEQAAAQTGKVEMDAETYARLMEMPSAMEKLQEEFSRKIDSAFGKIGNTEQMLRKIQDTPRGEIPTLTKEDLGALGTNYEYMSDDLLVALNGMLGKLKGTTAANPENIASLVQENLQQALPKLRSEIREEVTRDFEKRAVLQKHPDAEKLFGTKPLMDFIGTLPEAEQQVVLNSWRAEDVVPFLDKFKAHIAPPKKQPANVLPIDRKAALKAAVNPVSSAGTPRAKAEDDDFLAGYNSG